MTNAVSEPGDTGRFDIIEPTPADLMREDARAAEERDQIRRDIADLRLIMGSPPNDATGDEGNGMARTVAELWRASKSAGRKTTAAAGGAVVVVQVVIELLQQFGVLG